MSKCKCSSCPFEGRKRVKSSGLGSNRIGIILPYPSDADGEKGEICVDIYGNLLKGFLNNAKILPHQAKIIPLALVPQLLQSLKRRRHLKLVEGDLRRRLRV